MHVHRFNPQIYRIHIDYLTVLCSSNLTILFLSQFISLRSCLNWKNYSPYNAFSESNKIICGRTVTAKFFEYFGVINIIDQQWYSNPNMLVSRALFILKLRLGKCLYIKPIYRYCGIFESFSYKNFGLTLYYSRILSNFRRGSKCLLIAFTLSQIPNISRDPISLHNSIV